MAKDRFPTVEAARRAALKRLPYSIADFVDGGKEAETTVRENVAAFADVQFMPKVCTGITHPDVSTALLGEKIALPLVIAPTGFIRMVHPDGELGAARAAAQAGLPIAISTVSSFPAAQIQAANPHTWFQLYMIGGRAGARTCLGIARDAGCRTIVVTVSLAAVTHRDRPNPYLPMQVSLKDTLKFLPQIWNKPGWALGFWRSGMSLAVPNAPRSMDGRIMTTMEAGRALAETPPSWDDIAFIRANWQGKLVVKGIMRAEDAEQAAALGADAISVSNHGAKVLDGCPATIRVLPEVAQAVGGRVEILLDGGVRRGADIVRARALGAKAVLIGRPYIWGLAAGGQEGVRQVLEVFRQGTQATLAQLGCPSIDALDASYVRLR